MTFVEFLVSQQVLNRYQIDTLFDRIQQNRGDVERAFRDLKVEDSVIRRLRAQFYNIPEIEPNIPEISAQLFSKIPEAAAKHYRVVPVGITPEGVFVVGVVDPGSSEALNAVQFIFSESNTAYNVNVISFSDFEKIIARYSEAQIVTDVPVSSAPISGSGKQTKSAKTISEDDGGLILEAVSNVEDGNESPADTSGEKIVVDAPATKAFTVIISNAIAGKASDIHIEGSDTNVRVRYRVDGDLHTSLTFPKSMQNALVARVKILTKLKLDEKRKPQDGRFYARIGNRKIDFRVSIMPTFFGEKVVIRILDPDQNLTGTLEQMGMRTDHLDMVRRAIARPYGMILITGPTGSGKSTTLRTMIQEVDRERMNVVSLEDPVEYNIPGMNQSQVQAEIGYTFASGLRSILRQDPDVIMVGEIRDKETAQLAIQAALTGHLVFSTLHTNTAIGAIPRLLDMGVDPFLIPPVLVLTIAQRLAKRLNPNVPAIATPIDGAIREMMNRQFADFPEQFHSKLQFTDSFYDADPAATGALRGRVAVFEMLEMTQELEHVILKDPTEPAIYKYARENGFVTLREDALMKSMQGVASFTSAMEV